MIYNDHRTIPSCACVHDRLRVAVGLFDQARELNRLAVAGDDPHLGLKQVAESAKLRHAGVEEVREALRAIQEPPPHAALSPEQLAARRPSPSSTSAA